MKKILLIVISIILLCGCSSGKKDNTNERRIDDIIAENNYVIVDVRTQAEYNQGHVVGAINIPYDEIEKADLDSNKIIVVYCQSGKRSKIAYDTLVSKGYKVKDLGAYDTIKLDKE